MIKKYENVEQILQEFYDCRLRMYGSRKKALLSAMEHTLMKITNQARFIMMIVEGKLKISNRKRMAVVQDLKERKFDTWLAAKDSANTLRNRAKATDAFAEEDDAKEEAAETSANSMDVDAGSGADMKRYSQGYKYLLAMSLSSLTKERVEELKKKQAETLREVNALKQKTAKDLWRDDLNELDQHMSEDDAKYEEDVQLQHADAEKKRKAMASNNTKGKKNTRKKKVTKGKTSKSSTASKESSLEAGFGKLFKKKASPKKKKKVLSSSNKRNEDPFSMSKPKKQLSKKKKFIDSDDDSESPQLSLFERAQLRKNSPQKALLNSRKRKAVEQSDSDSGLEEFEPPRKKNKSSSVSTSGSSSSGTLKPIAVNKRKKKHKVMSDSESNSESNKSEEYRPPKNDSDDDDFDIEDD